MIILWRSKETQKIYNGEYSKKYPSNIQRKVRVKLRMLDSATQIKDLKIPPSNRLHKLSGSRNGEYSISINMQWRLCFEWKDNNALNVELVDYH